MKGGMFMKFKTFEDLGKYLGRKPRKPQKEWADAQKDKVLMCPKCKNRMTWVEGTNILVCQNEIKKDEDTKVCGYRKLIKGKTVGFLKYLNS